MKLPASDPRCHHGALAFVEVLVYADFGKGKRLVVWLNNWVHNGPDFFWPASGRHQPSRLLRGHKQAEFSLADVRAALEKAGCMFLDENGEWAGVRLMNGKGKRK